MEIASFISEETSEMEGKYLSFWTEQQLFGVPIADEVTSIGQNEILPLPQINAEYATSFLTGIAKQDEKIVLLISTKKLLGENEMDLLSNNIMGEIDV